MGCSQDNFRMNRKQRQRTHREYDIHYTKLKPGLIRSGFIHVRPAWVQSLG